MAEPQLCLVSAAHADPQGRRGRWHAPLLAAAACGLLVAVGMVHWWQAVASVRDTSTYHFSAYDFRSFYAAGRLVVEGRASQLYTHGVIAATGRAGGEPYFNPPFVALLWAPFSLMPFDAAYRVWTAINLGLLALNCWLIWRIAASIARPWRAILIAAFVTSAPVSHGLVLGQYSLLLSASWGGAYLLMERGRPRSAGLALTPLLIKPEMLVPLALFLIWKRERGVLATLLPATVVCVGISIAMVGPAAAFDYPFYLLRESEFQRTDAMFGWTGVIAALFGARPHLAVTLAASALGVATLAVGFLALRPRAPTLARSWLIVAMVTVLADLHLFFQDIAILAPMAVAYVASSPARHRPIAAVVAAGGWGILWFEPFMSAGVPVNVVFGCYVAFVIACMLPLWRRAEPAVTDAEALAA